MQRVIVIGSGGAGKSTFARQLGENLGLPVIHLDREFWQPCWIEPPKNVWAARVKELCAQLRWVMDGNYGGTLELRFAACDTVIFLDLPRWTCFARVLRRNLRYFGRARPDMNAGCPERLPRVEFLRWILEYPSTRRPKIMARLEGLKDQKRVVVLSTKSAIESFLCSVETSGALSPSRSVNPSH